MTESSVLQAIEACGFCRAEDYQLGIYPIHFGDIIEIDSLAELCEADPTYKSGVFGA